MNVIAPRLTYLRIFASLHTTFDRAPLGCIQVGTFITPKEAATWKQSFVVSAVYHGIRAQVYVHEISAWSLRKQKFDFDPGSVDGLPWEVVAALEGILPLKSTERASFSHTTI